MIFVRAKHFVKSNLINILLIIVTTIFYFIFQWNGCIIDFSTLSSSEHFNILSIASLFGGFVFTGIGIMLSGLAFSRIERLNDNGYMDKYYHTAYFALICNIGTILSAVIIISSKTTLPVMATIEQGLLYLSIVFFIKCMLDLRKIILKIRNK